MSEDVAAKETDLAGDRQAPSGIFTLGESGSEHYDLDHGVTTICDSCHGPLSRLLVRREAARSKRPRILCPGGCGRMATVYIRGSRTR